MAKATYSEEVSFEVVEFNPNDKKRLAKGEVGFGESFRMRGTGKDTVFYSHRSVNNHSEVVEEGQTIITFKDGTQKLLTVDEAKEKLKPIKAGKEATSEATPKVIVGLDNGTQQILSEEQSKGIVTPAADEAAGK